MSGLLEAADEFGKEIREKRDAEKAAKAMAEKAKEDAKKEIKRHEEDKKQGML